MHISVTEIGWMVYFPIHLSITKAHFIFRISLEKSQKQFLKAGIKLLQRDHFNILSLIYAVAFSLLKEGCTLMETLIIICK